MPRVLRKAYFACRQSIIVAGRTPNDSLFQEMASAASGQRILRIGDCLAPATIAAAVYSGHKFARDLGLEDSDEVPFRREDVALSPILENFAGETEDIVGIEQALRVGAE